METPLQMQIERNVTNGLSYRTDKKRKGLNSQEELQNHLNLLDFIVEKAEKGFIYTGRLPGFYYRNRILTDWSCDGRVDSYKPKE